MDRLKKLFNGLSLRTDIINILLGVALIVSMILIFKNPYNQYAILTACISGGIMNVMNGLKFRKDPKKRTMGMTYLMMGIIVIVLGFFIIEMI